jgi:hypothetical protein
MEGAGQLASNNNVSYVRSTVTLKVSKKIKLKVDGAQKIFKIMPGPIL